MMEKKLLTKAKPKKCEKHSKECEHTAQRRDETEGLVAKLKRVAPREKTPREIVVNMATLKEYLAENLKISVGQTAGGFTDPNARRIELTLEGEVISSLEFDVVQKREYEG